MILTVGNTKGGVGKTTLALNLAIARAVAGKRVWIVDGDRQGTAKIAMTIRAQAGNLPFIPCDKYPDGEQLHAQVQARSKQFDDVVIDAGGRDSSALRAALVLSDVILVPFAPRSLDVWALTDMCSLIDEARAVRTGLRAVAVLSMADNTGFYAQIHENFRMRFSSPFQQLLTILAQHAIRPKMPVKGLPRDSQLLA